MMTTDKTSEQIRKEVLREIPSSILFAYGSYDHNNISSSLFWDTHDTMVQKIRVNTEDLGNKIKQALYVKFVSVTFVEVSFR
jgi:hypothetical protein